MEKICPKCGHDLDSASFGGNLTFCPYCGTRIPGQTDEDFGFCPHCGEKREDSGNVCKHCGKAINTDTTEQTAAPKAASDNSPVSPLSPASPVSPALPGATKPVQTFMPPVQPRPTNTYTGTSNSDVFSAVNRASNTSTPYSYTPKTSGYYPPSSSLSDDMPSDVRSSMYSGKSSYMGGGYDSGYSSKWSSSSYGRTSGSYDSYMPSDDYRNYTKKGSNRGGLGGDSVVRICIIMILLIILIVAGILIYIYFS
jgi:hypothetical protein